MWIPVDPSVRAQAFAVNPGGVMHFRYSSYAPGGEPVHAELTYEEVRVVLARLALKGSK